MSLTATASERFWPATFAERGVTVPFTTPVLAAAKLRTLSPEKREFLIPGLSGSKGTYVVPAKAVPEMFKLTVHDRALLEEMERTQASSPYAIRMATLKVAGTGLAGAEAMNAAKAVLAAAENQELVTRLFVVVRALEQLSAGKEKWRMPARSAPGRSWRPPASVSTSSCRSFSTGSSSGATWWRRSASPAASPLVRCAASGSS
jgi:F0F1-type ATP synthase membrane subunit c/vacuolar-type H+-ATPase subunit K